MRRTSSRQPPAADWRCALGEIRNLLALYGREILDRLAIRAGYVPRDWYDHTVTSLEILRRQTIAMRIGGQYARAKMRRINAKAKAWEERYHRLRWQWRSTHP